MNDKKELFSFLLITCLFLISACCTMAKGQRYNDSINDYQREIDRLENELSYRDTTINNAVRELTAITDRSSTMEGTINELIELFDEYQRRVERMLFDYRKAEIETRSNVQDSNSANDNTGS